MKAKPVNIWFPTYVGDFFTATATMTGHEVGAYQLIIAALWKDGGAIPADDKKLAKLAKATPRQWKDIKESLYPFFEIKGGMISHPDVSIEIEKAKSNSEKKRAAGIASGARRRGENGQHPLNTCSAYVEPRAGDGDGDGYITLTSKKDIYRGGSGFDDGLVATFAPNGGGK